jgi:chaperone modulatory protein CbpM
MQPNFIITSPLQATSCALEEITELTLDDLCRACAAQADIIIELVSEGVIDPASMQPSQSNQTPEHWRFTGLHLHRAKVAMRLHRDLGVNFAGAALALELLDELQALKTKLRVYAI